jgi:DNA-binding PadR family transcriptional regulator
MVAPLPELGRFAEPALLILVSLADGPKHGYAIMADVEQGTGRPMGPGTLYAALARLEERGFIEALRRWTGDDRIA